MKDVLERYFMYRSVHMKPNKAWALACAITTTLGTLTLPK
jgi:hypothetical protein